ncbi:MAG: DsbC family protein [Pseudomonadales bacterium]|nr:DsbC family protein [Pseudomonadales bacterium]
MKKVSKLGLSATLFVALLGLQACKQEKATAEDSAQPAAEAPAAPTAEEPKAAADMVQLTPEEHIKKTLAANLPQLQVVSMMESSAKGIYQVEINGGEVIHVTSDGKHILNGDLLKVKAGGVDNVTEVWRSEKRVAALNGLKDETLVVYPATGEEKGEVIAFTDTSCGYCQKFHLEIPQLNAMGITVKYAAWPRYGLQSPAGQIMADIWCSKDREDAMTLAKTRKPVPKPEGECDTAAITDQINLGRQLGVRGTPAVFLGDGRKVGGYRKASDLAAEFGIAQAVPAK